MIQEHDRVVLKTPVPSEGLEAGDVGTVVHVHQDGVADEVYFVTLPDDAGTRPTGANYRSRGPRPRSRRPHHRRALKGQTRS